MIRKIFKACLLTTALGVLISFTAACTAVKAAQPRASTYANAPEMTQRATLSEIYEEDIPFAVQYVRSGFFEDNFESPQSAAIRSLDELHDYYDANQFPDSLTSFSETLSSYDAEFFNVSALIVNAFQEGSGSICHRVARVYSQNGMLRIDIDRILPEMYTCDMAFWYVITVVPQQSLDGRQIDVRVNDILINKS